MNIPKIDKTNLPETLKIISKLVDSFKSRVAGAGDDGIGVLRAIYDEGRKAESILLSVRHAASHHAKVRGARIVRLFKTYESGWPQTKIETFWNDFRRKLEDMEQVGSIFVADGLRDEASNIVPKIFTLNPPADIIAKLLGIRGFFLDSFFSNDKEPFLDLVLKNGGSIELVKLLVLRGMRNTKLVNFLSFEFSYLIGNRQKHDPNSFSEILRYLVHQGFSTETGNSGRSLLPSSGRSPLKLLWETLRKKKTGISYSDVLEDDDFVFMMKATYYAHHMQSENFNSTAIEDIDNIPLLHAFLKCYKRFYNDLGFAKGMVEELIVSGDEKKSVLVKDLGGEYPLFRLLAKADHFMSQPSNEKPLSKGKRKKSPVAFLKHKRHTALAKVILKLVPEAARLTNSNGLHPLHVAAHPDRFTGVSDRGRLAMVDAVLMAYPEAIDIIDKQTLLPPFLLPALFNKKRKQEYDISSSFFLLRERPGLLRQVNSVDIKKKRGKRAMVSEGPPDEKLLVGKEGWMKRTFRRQSGATVGKIDKYWYSPGGYKFASMVEIKRFLQALDGNDEAVAYKMCKPKAKSTSKRSLANVEDESAPDKKRAKVSK